MVYVLCLILFMVGLVGILTQKNVIKIIVSVAILEYATNVLFIMIGYKSGGTVPIIVTSGEAQKFSSIAVDPFPQAMVLTSIVIGLGVLTLLVAISLRLYHKYGTYDITEIRRLRG